MIVRQREQSEHQWLIYLLIVFHTKRFSVLLVNFDWMEDISREYIFNSYSDVDLFRINTQKQTLSGITL